MIKSKRPTVGKPKVHIGPIASGNTIFASTEGIGGLFQHWPRLIGVEMEVGGVAAAIVNAAESPGFLVVRAVVHTMDESKIDNWQEYGAAAAGESSSPSAVWVTAFKRHWDGLQIC